MIPRDRLVFIILAAVILAPFFTKTRQSVTKDTSAGFSVISSSRGFVHVSGDVRHPGSYPASANSVTGGVIKMAEPLLPVKSLSPPGVDKLPVINGTVIRVSIADGGRGTVVIAPLATSERLLLGIPLDINAMSGADFESLPGIGPVMAQRIITYRQNHGGFMMPQELLNIEGIGNKKYEKLKKYF